MSARSNSLSLSVVVAVVALGGVAEARAPHIGWLLPEVAELAAGQAPAVLPAPVSPYDYMTREQLLIEKRRLEDEMPGLAGPIILTAAGGSGLILGTYYFLDAASAMATLGVSGIFVGAVFLTAGIVCSVIGIIWLVSRINTRGPLAERIAAIERRLDTIYFMPPGLQEQAPPINVPPPPPPPPLPPPAANIQVPPPSLVVALF